MVLNLFEKGKKTKIRAFPCNSKRNLVFKHRFLYDYSKNKNYIKKK